VLFLTLTDCCCPLKTEPPTIAETPPIIIKKKMIPKTIYAKPEARKYLKNCFI
jgi:hypothetical protein